MKKGLIFVGVFALFLIPLVSFGADSFFGQIFPEELSRKVAQHPGNIGACDLVSLFDNVLRFAIYLAIMVATLMFTYAGFLYVTAAANQENINTARKIFGNVFLGLVFILGAWLIVNLIMNVFLDTDKTKLPWNSIECVERNFQTTPFGPPGIDASLPGNPDAVPLPSLESAVDHQTALDTFEDEGITVTSTSGADGVKEDCFGTGCTSLKNIQESVVDNTVNLKRACSECDIQVNGGTERGVHEAGDTGHEAGFKIDLQGNGPLDDFIENSGKFTRAGSRGGNPQYKDVCGNSYVRESGHWDITVVQACSF